MAKLPEKGKATKDPKAVAETKPDATPEVAVEQSTEQTEDSKAAKNESFALPGNQYMYGPGGPYFKEPVPPIKADDLDERMQTVMKAVEELRDGVTPKYEFRPKGEPALPHLFAEYSGKQINEMMRFVELRSARYNVQNYLLGLSISEKNKAHEIEVDYYGSMSSSQSTGRAISDLQKVVAEGSKYWKMLDEVDESDIRLQKINQILIGNFLGLQEFEQYDNGNTPPWEMAQETDTCFDEFCNSLIRVSSLVTSFYSKHRHHIENSINYLVPVTAAKAVKNPFYVLACANTQTDLLRSFATNFNSYASSNKEDEFYGRWMLEAIGPDFAKQATDEIIFTDNLKPYGTYHDKSFVEVTRSIAELRRVIIREVSKGKRVFGILGMMIENIVMAVARVASDVLNTFNLWVRAYDRAGLDVTEVLKHVTKQRTESHISNITEARDYDCPF